MEKPDKLSKKELKKLDPQERSDYRAAMKKWQIWNREQQKIKAAQQREEARIVDERIQAGLIWGIKKRQHQPSRVVAMLGPTNSGKTYQAIQELVAYGSGTYAAPLRMLAQEVYEELHQELGDGVGLITGEESINPEAPILCTTTEMAPLRGGLLVLDEVHWAADPQRGWAWTKLLVGAEYEELILLGSVDVMPLLEACFADKLDLQIFQRFGSLKWDGEVGINNLEAGDAVVVYSRKTALHLAKVIGKRFGSQRVAILYGAMPLESRRNEIKRIRSGKADILVCTDVVGHGLNLPIRRVIFAETSKYDGTKRRELLAWEVSQIAGRAGRYGQYEQGLVGKLGGSQWYTPNTNTITKGLVAGTTVCEERELKGFRKISTALVRPSLLDLGPVGLEHMEKAVYLWRKGAFKELKSISWLSVESTTELQGRLRIISRVFKNKEPGISSEQAWALAHSPLAPGDNYQAGLLADMTRALSGGKALNDRFDLNIEKTSLEEAERLASSAAALRWFVSCFGDGYGISAIHAAKLEKLASARVEKLLPQTILNLPEGCSGCGTKIAPWFDSCYRCAFGPAEPWHWD